MVYHSFGLIGPVVLQVFPSVHIGELQTCWSNHDESDVVVGGDGCRCCGTTDGNPLVSVVMPVFNANVTHFREAWRSVVASGSELRRRRRRTRTHGTNACGCANGERKRAAPAVQTGVERDRGCTCSPLIQIVCVNDGSTDHGATASVIQELSEQVRAHVCVGKQRCTNFVHFSTQSCSDFLLATGPMLVGSHSDPPPSQWRSRRCPQ